MKRISGASVIFLLFQHIFIRDREMNALKKYVMLCAVIAAMMILTPLFSVKYTNEAIENALKENENKSEYISVMMTATGETSEMKIREYIIGCVAGEMNPEYHVEALKAQAVASYTFAKYIKNRDNKTSGADISDDSSVYQAYIDENARKEKWKDNFEKYESAVEDAVDTVLGETITYNSEPIMAVYFDKCGGRTESSENIWGRKVPYLVSVTSDGDLLAPDIETVTEYTYDEFKDAFSKKNINFNTDAQTVKINEKFDSGAVKSVSVCGTEMSGTDFRSALNLKSAAFSVVKDNEHITVTCTGNGHFVGMSQYGADYMARQGSDYREILAHYYPETEIK